MDLHSGGSGGGGSSRTSVESDSSQEVLRMRSSRLECLTAGLVLIDLALVTHQLAIDASATSSANKNTTATARPTWQQGSNQFYTSALVFSCAFVIETIWRNVRNLMKQRRLIALDALDGCVCICSCALNFGLHFGGVHRLLCDLLALLVAARLGRTMQLCRGLIHSEKRRLLQLLNSHQQIEAASSERLRMLQTELANRDLECQDLRALIKAATLSRHRLKMKQQLQMEKPLPEQRMLSPPPPTPLRRTQKQQPHHHYDSGHSSDSAPDSPQEAEPAAMEEAAAEAAEAAEAAGAAGATGAAEVATDMRDVADADEGQSVCSPAETAQADHHAVDLNTA